MARHLALGNGSLLVNLDGHSFIRDIYYPYVGEYNHVGGHCCRFGVWADGSFFWLDDPSWSISCRYADSTLVSSTEAVNRKLGLRLLIQEGVHQRDPILIRQIEVFNELDLEREVRLFFHQDLSIAESEVGDTAAFVPENRSIVHYKKRYYFMFNGSAGGEGISQYSTGVKRFNNSKGTWVDAEDGLLQGNPIAQGSVDSVVGFRLVVPARASRPMHYWMTVGRNMREVKTLDHNVRDKGPEHLLTRVKIYWKHWINKTERDYADLSDEAIRLFKLSLLIVRTQTDIRGAITAANDTDILQFNRDHYSYVWPRDGAIIAAAVSAAGHADMVKPFFAFCAEALSPEGYLHHKYNPDGTIGSSWHPFIAAGKAQLPIQVDETGMVLYAFWQMYEKDGDLELARSLYKPLVVKAGHFLSHFIDEELMLPLPTYDLWEERLGIYTFSVSAVYAGLIAASNFSGLFGEEERCRAFREAADGIKEALIARLWDEEKQRFIRGLYRKNGKWVKDETLESSTYGVVAFGVLPPDDPRVAATMEAIADGLAVKTEVGGIARYDNDYYFQRSQDLAAVPGNPWIICTLWLAEWQIASARSPEDLERPRRLIDWAAGHALPSGVLSEQLDPYTGEPLSVAPLTWSHAGYISACVGYMAKASELGRNKTRSPERADASKQN